MNQMVSYHTASHPAHTPTSSARAVNQMVSYRFSRKVAVRQRHALEIAFCSQNNLAHRLRL